MLLPRNAPDKITIATTTSFSYVQFAITNSVAANSSSCTHIAGTVPRHFCSLGATNTDVNASISPQPRNT
ncbi:hypothetical protein D3C84_1236540 [compost metagenome]